MRRLADWPPPMRGVPGPGYDKYPWHVLLYGRGDAYQRARIFMLLARQLRIDVVMLGIDRKTGRAEEWLPAVLLDKQLYLFDTELGLPIPGPGGRGIATLAQVIADPQLLESLDVGDKYRYRVRAADLDKVVVLLDASAEHLSQRMRLVEQNLGAADQMILSVSTSDLKQEFAGCQGVTDVRLWAVPLEADMYQRARVMMMAASPEMQWQEFLDHGVFQELSYRRARAPTAFAGEFENQGDKLGATTYYLAARMSKAQIEEMETNRGLQKALGLEKTLGMPDREWQQRLQQAAATAGRIEEPRQLLAGPDPHGTARTTTWPSIGSRSARSTMTRTDRGRPEPATTWRGAMKRSAAPKKPANST